MMRSHTGYNASNDGIGSRIIRLNPTDESGNGGKRAEAEDRRKPQSRSITTRRKEVTKD